MNYYFVAYHYVNGNKSGFGSIEIGINDVFVPIDIEDHLKELNKFDGVVIINWKPIEINQLCPELYRAVDKEEDNDDES